MACQRKGAETKEDMDISGKVRYEKCNLSEDFALDRLDWRNKILVADPNELRTCFDDDDE